MNLRVGLCYAIHRYNNGNSGLVEFSWGLTHIWEETRLENILMKFEQETCWNESKQVDTRLGSPYTTTFYSHENRLTEWKSDNNPGLSCQILDIYIPLKVNTDPQTKTTSAKRPKPLINVITKFYVSVMRFFKAAFNWWIKNKHSGVL